MAGPGLIVQTYLGELAHELRVPRRLRHRILAEVGDHLVDASAGWRERGLDAQEAERRATADFGSAQLVSRRFGEELAARSAHESSNTVAVALLAVLVLEGLVGSNLARETSLWTDAPYGIVVFFALQVAIVAGVLTFARSLRHRRSSRIEPAALRLITRGNLVVAGAIAVSVGLNASVALDHLPLIGRSGWATVAALGTGAVALLVAAALRSVARARVRAQAVAHLVGSPTAARDADALGDLVAVVELARDWIERRAPRLAPTTGRVESVLGSLASRLAARAPRLRTWLDLRRHPWRFALAAAATAGVLVAGQHAIADGGLPGLSDLPGALLASLVLVSVEAAGALTGFAVLGRYLGIRA